MKIKQVKCKSGLMGWQTKLQNNYANFEEFQSYSENYGISKKLGFSSDMKAWKANPVIQGSVNRSDFKIVS